MILSQHIARLLEEMLEEAGGEVSIVRNEFAQKMGCVPSQINYVITSRFTPERGYVVESRRGGGGFIRIRKVPMQESEYLARFYRALENPVPLEIAGAYLSRLVSDGILTSREGALLLASVNDRALRFVSREGRDMMRSAVLQSAILTLIAEKEREE
ncbi:MAG: CtsR family transcriptional regulator [Clostridia bacterium]|nr:CtsR family transcriptional regulator [Clostridia bacterium]